MNHAKCYRPGYPRIQFTRNNFYDLNGEWNFEILSKDFDILVCSNNTYKRVSAFLGDSNLNFISKQ
mgnify:CR=1 FL=1